MLQLRNKTLSPIIPLVAGYLFLLISAGIMGLTGFFIDSTFLQWGPPVSLMGQEITSQFQFYLMLSIFFGRQLINTWIDQTTYPFILNEIQDPKTEAVKYSCFTSLSIVLANALYSELGLLFAVAGATTQISFFVAIVTAELLAEGIVNWCHLARKRCTVLI